jgi:hypothetical protein
MGESKRKMGATRRLMRITHWLSHIHFLGFPIFWRFHRRVVHYWHRERMREIKPIIDPDFIKSEEIE